MSTEHMTVSQAARALGISAERVRQLAANGALPSVRTPLGRLFASSDVERLRAQRQALRHRATGEEA